MKTSGAYQSQLKILSRAVIDTMSNKMIDFHVKWENVRKEAAQLRLMEYNIDAEDNVEIAQYKVLDIHQIKNDKLRMEAKMSALENKLRKHEKYLPDIRELEKQEVTMLYQEYLVDVKLEQERIEEILEEKDLFKETLSLEEFAILYNGFR